MLGGKMERYTVFVYGTLKKSHVNHHYLEGSDCLGAGKSVEKYALYVEGIPFVVRHEHVSHIYGELYSINAATLNKMDCLEGHPSWYERKEVEILLDTDKTILAWLYFYPEKRGKLVKNGRYLKR
jgi:gamma-glutamylaminecyclotransferase